MRTLIDSQDRPVESTENTPQEVFDTNLSELAQAWEIDARNIDLTSRIFAAIAPQDWARNRGIPFVDLRKHHAEPSAIATLTAEFAGRHLALPVHRDGNRLWVAFADPTDIVTVDAVRMASRCLVQPMAADPDELKRSIADAYGASAPPQPPRLPTAPAAPAPEPDEESARLLRAALAELRELRKEISSLRSEVAELRQDQGKTVPRPSTGRLFPFAPETAAHRAQ